MMNAGKTSGITLRTLKIHLLVIIRQPGYHTKSFSGISLPYFTKSCRNGPHLVNWNIYIITIIAIILKAQFTVMWVSREILWNWNKYYFVSLLFEIEVLRAKVYFCFLHLFAYCLNYLNKLNFLECCNNKITWVEKDS